MGIIMSLMGANRWRNNETMPPNMKEFMSQKRKNPEIFCRWHRIEANDSENKGKIPTFYAIQLNWQCHETKKGKKLSQRYMHGARKLKRSEKKRARWNVLIPYRNDISFLIRIQCVHPCAMDGVFFSFWAVTFSLQEKKHKARVKQVHSSFVMFQLSWTTQGAREYFTNKQTSKCLQCSEPKRTC